MKCSQEVLDAYLSFAAAQKVQESRLMIVESAFINGSMETVQLALSGYMASAEAVTDRLRDLTWSRMRADGIDPITRRPM